MPVAPTVGEAVHGHDHAGHGQQASGVRNVKAFDDARIGWESELLLQLPQACGGVRLVHVHVRLRAEGTAMRHLLEPQPGVANHGGLLEIARL